MRCSNTAAPRLRPFATVVFAAVLILAGCGDDRISRLVVKGEFEPKTLDFGEVQVGMSKLLPVVFKNTGTPAFTIDAVEVPQPFTFGNLKESLIGKSIAPGGSLALDIQFDATTEGSFSGTFKVKSGTAVAELRVHGIALVRRIPNLSIDPAAIDFGAVEIPTEVRKPFTVKNTGNAPGTIDKASLQTSGMAIRANDEFRIDLALPITVMPGATQVFNAIFKPAQAGPRQDKILLGPMGSGTPLSLVVTGEGRVPQGDIFCTPSSVEFGEVSRGMTLAKQVSCSARGGPARIVSIQTMGPYFDARMPPRAMDLASGASVTIDLEYKPDGPIMNNQRAMPHMGTLAVEYMGGRGAATVNVPLRGAMIQPPPMTQAIALVLSWDTNLTDVDIHLQRPGAMSFDRAGGDCFYAIRNPHWGLGAPSDTSMDPFLDRDVINGYGPENLNLARAPAPGAYTVTAHFFSDHGHPNPPTTATVKVYVNGSLAGTFTHLLRCDDLWTVGVVNWNGTSGTFAPSNAVRPRSGFGVCF